jgi:hypothetical protein
MWSPPALPSTSGAGQANGRDAGGKKGPDIRHQRAGEGNLRMRLQQIGKVAKDGPDEPAIPLL